MAWTQSVVQRQAPIKATNSMQIPFNCGRVADVDWSILVKIYFLESTKLVTGG